MRAGAHSRSGKRGEECSFRVGNPQLGLGNWVSKLNELKNFKRGVKEYAFCIVFKFIYLEDTFIQNDLQWEDQQTQSGQQKVQRFVSDMISPS